MLSLAFDPADLHCVRVKLTKLRRDLGDLIADVEGWSSTPADERFIEFLTNALGQLTSAAVGAAAAVTGLDAEPEPVDLDPETP